MLYIFRNLRDFCLNPIKYNVNVGVGEGVMVVRGVSTWYTRLNDIDWSQYKNNLSKHSGKLSSRPLFSTVKMSNVAMPIDSMQKKPSA